MKLTNAIWNKYSVDTVLKFCVDIKKKQIFFHDFNMDHFIFSMSIINRKRPTTREELFDVLDNLQNRIIGGSLIKEKNRFVCLLGTSGIEYELKPANKEHDEISINIAADLCSTEFSKNASFRPLIINTYINGKTTEHIRFS